MNPVESKDYDQSGSRSMGGGVPPILLQPRVPNTYVTKYHADKRNEYAEFLTNDKNADESATGGWWVGPMLTKC